MPRASPRRRLQRPWPRVRAPRRSQEYFTRDPFGNVAYHRRYGDLDSEGDQGTEFLNGHDDNKGGRIGASAEQWIVKVSGNQVPQPADWAPTYTTYGYDAGRGSLTGTLSEAFSAWSYSGGTYGYDDAEAGLVHRSQAKSYYAADGKLRVHQVNRDSLFFIHQIDESVDTLAGDAYGTYEEYWYDALGRRVLKRTRESSEICAYASRCYSAIERFVWDGDQILWELRDSGQSNVADPPPTPSNGQTGHVGYIHVGGIDAPIAMIRNDSAIVLHRDYRGLYFGGTTTTGATFASTVPWPSSGVPRFLSGGLWDPHSTFTWVGSLPMSQQDETGLAYRRNRYYDTRSGQFISVDPIGIAGGLNLYGYANGDPINFSDPFGLKVCYEGTAREQRALKAASEKATGYDIDVDDDYCVKSLMLRPGTHDLAEAQAGFWGLHQQSTTYTIKFGSRPSFGLGTVAQIFGGINDSGPRQGQPFGYPSQLIPTFGSDGTCARATRPSLSQAVAHELAHIYSGGNLSESYATRLENAYLQSAGRPLRCGY